MSIGGSSLGRVFWISEEVNWHVPAGLVPQATTFAQILAAAHNVADQTFAAVQALLVLRQRPLAIRRR